MSRLPRTPGALAQPSPVVVAQSPDDGLPNAVDVDPARIIGPVLTRQGWVVPPSRTPQEQAALAKSLQG